MTRLREGDDQALNEIMQRWQQPLANYLFRLTGHSEDALDLAQEAFVRVYENRLKYRPTGRFSTWLFTIATNLGRNHARWKRRHPAAFVPDEETSPEDAIPDEAPQPGESVLAHEREEEVRRAIGELPVDLREALILTEYEELSHQEAAEILGCSSKAVETRIYRAKGLLRQRLERFLAAEGA